MIPTITVDQMREVDRLMMEELQIGLLQMMENAGRALAQQARHLLGGDVRGSHVVVLAGGGGLTAARRLSIWGADVSVILGSKPLRISGRTTSSVGNRPRRESGALLAEGPLGWRIPGLCPYKFLYVWLDLNLPDGIQEKSMG